MKRTNSTAVIAGTLGGMVIVLAGATGCGGGEQREARTPRVQTTHVTSAVVARSTPEPHRETPEERRARVEKHRELRDAERAQVLAFAAECGASTGPYSKVERTKMRQKEMDDRQAQLEAANAVDATSPALPPGATSTATPTGSESPADALDRACDAAVLAAASITVENDGAKPKATEPGADVKLK